MVITVNCLFINNISFINSEGFVVDKIKKYLIELDHYDNCIKTNLKERCIIQHQKMIDSREDMDNAIVDFYSKVH